MPTFSRIIILYPVFLDIILIALIISEISIHKLFLIVTIIRSRNALFMLNIDSIKINIFSFFSKKGYFTIFNQLVTTMNKEIIIVKLRLLIILRFSIINFNFRSNHFNFNIIPIIR